MKYIYTYIYTYIYIYIHIYINIPKSGTNARFKRYRNNSNWMKALTQGYKVKSSGHNGFANNTIPNLKESVL